MARNDKNVYVGSLLIASCTLSWMTFSAANNVFARFGRACDGSFMTSVMRLNNMNIAEKPFGMAVL